MAKSAIKAGAASAAPAHADGTATVPARPTIQERELRPARYSYGGDEFLFVELSEEMSFRANFKGRAMLQILEERQVPGIVDLCPNSTSCLIHFDPDELAPDELIGELKSIEERLGDPADFHFSARVIDIPIYYDDPWSTECLMAYRDRHQDPNATDLEYMASINGFKTVEDLIAAHSAPLYLVMGVGFTPACYWSAAMVPREDVIVAPTYIRPRTTTPERTFSHGGCFAAIYPSPGPGGYQLIGMAAAPIFDPRQTLPDFADSPVFTRTGDAFKHRPIDRDEFDALRREVEAGTFRYRAREVDFEPRKLFENPWAYNEELLEALYAD
jgi:allophanate hydrolase subunit 1